MVEVETDPSGRIKKITAGYEMTPGGILMPKEMAIKGNPVTKKKEAGKTSAEQLGAGIHDTLKQRFSSWGEKVGYQARYATDDEEAEVVRGQTQVTGHRKAMEHAKISGRVYAIKTENEAGTIFQAPSSKVEAEHDSEINIGVGVNIQDGAVIIAEGTNDMFIGSLVSVAHGAQVINSDIGEGTFVGFNSRINNATVGEGCVIEHAVYVAPGIVIPDSVFVRSGQHIIRQEQADKLVEDQKITGDYKYRTLNLGGEIDPVKEDYTERLTSMITRLVKGKDVDELRGVVGVNIKDLLYKYLDMGEDSGLHESPNGEAEFLDDTSVHIMSGAVVRGAMTVGAGVYFGPGCIVRNDEPKDEKDGGYYIGKNVTVGKNVIMHALKTESEGDEPANTVQIGVKGSDRKYWSIFVDEGAVIENGALIHGNASIGKGAKVREKAIIFKAGVGAETEVGAYAVVWDDSNVGNNAKIGDRSVLYNNAEVGDETTTMENFICGGVVGKKCKIGSHVRVERGATVGDGCNVGNNIIIKAGARIPSGTPIPDQKSADRYAPKTED